VQSSISYNCNFQIALGDIAGLRFPIPFVRVDVFFLFTNFGGLTWTSRFFYSVARHENKHCCWSALQAAVKGFAPR